MSIFEEIVESDADKSDMEETIDAMWNDCIDRGSFGYSAHYEAIVWKLPEMFATLKRLVKDLTDFKRLCKSIPGICKWMPYTSEEDYWGYTHTIRMGPLREKASRADKLEEILSDFEE